MWAINAVGSSPSWTAEPRTTSCPRVLRLAGPKQGFLRARTSPGLVRQADGSTRATQGTFAASLVLGELDEPTTFSVFDVGCGVDVLLGYSWLQTHDLTFLYEAAQVSFCQAAGCPDPSHRVRLDVALPSASPPTAAALMSPRELRSLLGGVGLGAATILDRPSLWRPPSPTRGKAATVAALAAAAQEAWAADTLASLAEHGLTLEDVRSSAWASSLSRPRTCRSASPRRRRTPRSLTRSSLSSRRSWPARPPVCPRLAAQSTSCILTLAMPRCRARALRGAGARVSWTSVAARLRLS